ncbi:MAG: hypothetical protein AB1374_04550 [Bacillota bacterium]
MNSTISPSKADGKTETITGLLELLSRYGVRVYLQDSRLKVSRPWPSWDDAPGPVRVTLRWLKARKEKLRRYLEEQQDAGLMELCSWTEPCTDEEKRQEKDVFKREVGTNGTNGTSLMGDSENVPPEPERKRSAFLDRWPPLSDLITRLEAAGFKLELDGERLRVIPPAPPEELPSDILELFNQAVAREKAIILHLRGREHQETIRRNCRAYILPPGEDPMDYCYNPESGRWEQRPGWWKGVVH